MQKNRTLDRIIDQEERLFEEDEPYKGSYAQ